GRGDRRLGVRPPAAGRAGPPRRGGRRHRVGHRVGRRRPPPLTPAALPGVDGPARASSPGQQPVADAVVGGTGQVITAMDVSTCFADSPREKMGEPTRRFRQLGIGYANLGALLMATGHAYDSDGGRALAAAVTSLMTGTAYRRSAELAATVGAYE